MEIFKKIIFNIFIFTIRNFFNSNFKQLTYGSWTNCTLNFRNQA